MLEPGTPTTLYTGTLGGGVFRSVDGGGIWFALNAGLTNLFVLALAVDAGTPATVYAGTNGGGVFKIVDGGGSWSPANTGLTSLDVRALAIDPATPATLYAGPFGAGVSKSVDGGGNWGALNTELTNLFVRTLRVDPGTPTTVYAGTVGGGVFGIRQLPIAPGAAASLALGATALRAGDVLRVDLVGANLGPAGFVDVLFGVVLPASVSAGLGCSGSAAAFLTEGFQQVALRCLTASPATFPPLIREVRLPATLPATAVPGFFSVVLPPGVPPGDYVVFLALTAPEAFADGVADPGDVIAVAVVPFTVLP